MKHQRELALKIYKKLDDWIAVGNKAENDAMDEVCHVIKDAIESEQKIQVELNIKFMDFIIESKIFNYIDPPPEKLPPMENNNEGKFNIPQLRSLVKELSALADDSGRIQNRNVVQLLKRKSNNSATLCDFGGLPKAWSAFGQKGFEKMVRNLDSWGSGSVDFKLLATCCILLLSDLPSGTQLGDLRRQLGSQSEVDLDTFLSLKPWFAAQEASADREYSIPFPRLQHIKELIFDLFSSEGTLNVDTLATYLLPSSLMRVGPACSAYQDLLV